LDGASPQNYFFVDTRRFPHSRAFYPALTFF